MLVFQYYAISGHQYGGRVVNAQRTIYLSHRSSIIFDVKYTKLLKAHEIFRLGFGKPRSYNADVSNINYSSPFNLRMNFCIDLKFARNTCSKDIQNI